MYATLYDFLRMSPEDQARVTTLDLSIADADDLALARLRQWQAPEAPGEERWQEQGQ